MSGMKDKIKGGLRPGDKSGGSRKGFSVRGDVKGANKVAGWVGHGKSTEGHTDENHRSVPLSALRDPAEFAPPPRRIPGQTPPPTENPTSPPAVGARPAPAIPSRNAQPVEEERRPIGGARDSTGLQTSHLPPPPQHRDLGAGSVASPTSPPVPARMGATAPPAPPRSNAPKPSLPPRLPPRQNEDVNEYTPAAPPSYQDATQLNSAATDQGIMNPGAVSRLGAAGVHVPGFEIGGGGGGAAAAAPAPSPTSPQRSSIASGGAAGFGTGDNELQARLARMRMRAEGDAGTGGASTSPTTPTSSTGLAAAAAKKHPPPAPPKKPADLHSTPASSAAAEAGVPPPIPLGSKPGMN